MVLSALVGSARGNVVLGWGVERIRAYCVWDNDNWNMTNPWDVDSGADAGQNVSIAVIDSGVDYLTDDQGQIHYHPDLAANIAGGKGFLYLVEYLQILNAYDDEIGHGTEVIGVIAAVVNGLGANQSGIIGAAPKTHIWALRTYGNRPQEIAAAINYSVDVLGVQIINISLQSDDNYSEIFTACNHALARGALIFACSGNFPPGNGTITYPALYNSVIAVGATCENDSRASFSNYGPKLCFMAPGFEINTTYGTTNHHFSYIVDNGTSFAAPHASATAALIWSSKVDPNFDFNHDGMWENDEVWAKMITTTLDLGPPGKDNETGWGLVNAWLSYQRPIGDINNNNVVDGTDLSIVASAFGSWPGSPRWDPRADVDIDEVVDGTDMAIIARHFGEGDP
jgi:subtilisin